MVVEYRNTNPSVDYWHFNTTLKPISTYKQMGWRQKDNCDEEQYNRKFCGGGGRRVGGREGKSIFLLAERNYQFCENLGGSLAPGNRLA